VPHFALTHNVSLDFMTKWREQNQDNFLVLENLLLFAPSADAAHGMVREREKLKCGVERIEAPPAPKPGEPVVYTYTDHRLKAMA
jgi:hypothetical protein